MDRGQRMVEVGLVLGLVACAGLWCAFHGALLWAFFRVALGLTH